MKIAFEVSEETAAFIREDAARRQMSEEGYVSLLLEKGVAKARDYREAEKRFFSHLPFNFEYVDGRRPTREELHERTRLR